MGFVLGLIAMQVLVRVRLFWNKERSFAVLLTLVIVYLLDHASPSACMRPGA